MRILGSFKDNTLGRETEYSKKYEEAQDRCYTICIPRSNSIQSIQIDQKFTALMRLEYAVIQLKDNYMMIKGFLLETSSKPKGIWSKYAEIFHVQLKKQHCTEDRVKYNINQAIESYIMGNLHNELFQVILEECNDKDTALRQKCETLRHLPPEYLGIVKQLCCSMPNAISELNALKRCKTPLEMLFCINSSLDWTMVAIRAHLLSTHDAEEALCALVESDDLCPSRIVYYIENYHWTATKTDGVRIIRKLDQSEREFVLANERSFPDEAKANALTKSTGTVKLKSIKTLNLYHLANACLFITTSTF
ncbi:hypothetical protein LSH36_697g03146 [Paralvinella palmiformis]|uniref:Uncharacterized protein n=1 Tax=Paralvinella palmiformis TaxID=53620 RepID=A0AAD9J264_9ANNE|nr:hypothetical protein LSH36_697g03146 [Paralvinella palmiformis]